MNSNYGKGSSGSLNNFQFDFGIGASRPKSLNDQKSHSSSSYSSSWTAYSTGQPKPAWQPNKPSWTHQPAPSQGSRSEIGSGPNSMVGDIFGRTWTSPSMGSGSGIGIVNKDPNLFGDLVSSAMVHGKSSSNVPLKNASPAQAAHKSPYSMGSLADTLPKMSNTVKSGANWGSTKNTNVSSVESNSLGDNANVNRNNGPNLGGPSMKSTASGGSGIGISSSKDPLVSLVDFSSKQSGIGGLNSGNKKPGTGNEAFGDFQSASKSNGGTATFQTSVFSSSSNNDYLGSNLRSSQKIDDYPMPTKDFSSQTKPSDQSSGGDPFDMFFSAPSASGGAREPVKAPAIDDWGLGSEFGLGSDDSVGATTELEGLPPPPAGVSPSSAKTKGVENQKQGQYADAIKWLSWAVILMEKAGDETGIVEVLSCRASCYKEVGEYKKAVADCSKVLDFDKSNVTILVQRALLYESMEKYRLGAEDLRNVLKIDPGNRVARSTIHRLNKMAE